MKGRTLIITGVIFAIIAALLFLYSNSITKSGVIVGGGILFVGAGLINLVFYGSGSGSPSGMGRVYTFISNSAAVVLGICMLVFREKFSDIVPFIFGLLVAVAALWQFFTLALGVRPHQLPGWLYFIPILIAGASVFIFLQHETIADRPIMLATGGAMALFAVGCIIEGCLVGVANRRMAAGNAEHEGSKPEEKPKEKPKREVLEGDADLDDPIIDKSKKADEEKVVEHVAAPATTSSTPAATHASETSGADDDDSTIDLDDFRS